MSSQSAIDAALEANQRYAREFTPSEAGQPRLAVVLCMDARIDPIRALGLRYGHAHIIRNAGGRMVDAIRSLAISQRFLGTSEVAVIHHTECGMMLFTDEEMRAKLAEMGLQPGDSPFHTFRSLDQSVREDLALYRTSPLVRQDIPLRGFVYEVAEGRLREVES